MRTAAAKAAAHEAAALEKQRYINRAETELAAAQEAAERATSQARTLQKEMSERNSSTDEMAAKLLKFQKEACMVMVGVVVAA